VFSIFDFGDFFPARGDFPAFIFLLAPDVTCDPALPFLFSFLGVFVGIFVIAFADDSSVKDAMDVTNAKPTREIPLVTNRVAINPADPDRIGDDFSDSQTGY
jgi:hypothetical protein